MSEKYKENGKFSFHCFEISLTNQCYCKKQKEKKNQIKNPKYS